MPEVRGVRRAARGRDRVAYVNRSGRIDPRRDMRRCHRPPGGIPHPLPGDEVTGPERWSAAKRAIPCRVGDDGVPRRGDC